MNKQESTPNHPTRPEWATETEDLGDAGGAVRWSRVVHEVTDGVDVSVDLTQFVDHEGADEPTVRVWVEGTVLDLAGVDDSKLTPAWLGRLGQELRVGSERAQAVLDAAKIGAPAIAALPLFDRPQWAVDIDSDLTSTTLDGSPQATWSRTVHADAHLDVGLTRYDEIVDGKPVAGAPFLQVWVEGQALEVPDAEALSPDVVEHIALGLLLAVAKARAALETRDA